MDTLFAIGNMNSKGSYSGSGFIFKTAKDIIEMLSRPGFSLSYRERLFLVTLDNGLVPFKSIQGNILFAIFGRDLNVDIKLYIKNNSSKKAIKELLNMGITIG